jgi:hypothetical protein
MIWLLPIFLVALALVAMALQRRATTLFGDIGCARDRHNHSICPHHVAGRGRVPQRGTDVTQRGA